MSPPGDRSTDRGLVPRQLPLCCTVAIVGRCPSQPDPLQRHEGPARIAILEDVHGFRRRRLRLELREEGPDSIRRQIVEGFRAWILSGAMRADAPLPSIRALARSHEIHPHTVQRAYDELARLGLVVPRQGTGCYVAILPATARKAVARRRLTSRLEAIVATAVAEGLSRTEVRLSVNVLLKRLRPP